MVYTPTLGHARISVGYPGKAVCRGRWTGGIAVQGIIVSSR